MTQCNRALDHLKSLNVRQVTAFVEHAKVMTRSLASVDKTDTLEIKGEAERAAMTVEFLVDIFLRPARKNMCTSMQIRLAGMTTYRR